MKQVKWAGMVSLLVLVAAIFSGEVLAAEEIASLPKLEPAKLTADRQAIPLSSPCTNIVAGAGGRLLILWFPEERKLSMFDVVEARIVKDIPVASTEIKFAAGADTLIIALTDQKIFQRWSLTTFKREAMVPFPKDTVIDSIALGSASHGPLGILAQGISRSGLGVFDLKTLQKLPYSVDRPTHTFMNQLNRADFRASANGAVFACTDANGLSSGRTFTNSFSKDESIFRECEYSSSLLGVPSPDGQRIYTGQAIQSSRGNAWVLPQDGVPWSAVIPAVQGNWYLALPWPAPEPVAARKPPRPAGKKPRPEIGGGSGGFDTSDRNAAGEKEEAQAESSLLVHLYHTSDTRPVCALEGVNLMPAPGDDHFAPFGGRDRAPSIDRLTLDKRAWLIPDAKLLAVLSRSNTELVLHRVDISQLAAKSELDFLVIESDAPAAVESGTEFKYALRVLSKLGGLKYSLWQGPPKMTLSEQGVLTWTGVKSGIDQQHEVVVSVTDASGREAFQAFTLTSKRIQAADLPETEVVEEEEEPIEPSVARQQSLGIPPVDKLPELKPVALPGGKLSVPLPDSLTNVVPGGAGRYLVLHFAQRGEVAVFDVTQAKIIYQIPVQDVRVHIAAGLEKLVIILAEKRIALRYDLATGEREQVTRLAGDTPIINAVLGSASHGPLITGCYARERGKEALIVYDLTTFERLPTLADSIGSFNGRYFFRAFRDGTMFSVSNHRNEYGGTLILVGRQWVSLPNTWKAGEAPPELKYDPVSPAGEVFLRQGRDRELPEFRPRWVDLPERGDYYFTFDYTPQQGISNGKLHLIGDRTPLVALPAVRVPNDTMQPDTGFRLPPDRHIHLIPDANLLITIPPTANRLDLVSLDPAELAAKSPLNYLVVRSIPPRSVARGDLYRYPLDVLSKQGDVKYAVEIGPQGMTISPAGELLWKVPLAVEEPAEKNVDRDEVHLDEVNLDEDESREEQVVLSIRSGEDQERLQSFKIQVLKANKIQALKANPQPLAATDDEQVPRVRTWIDYTGKRRMQATFVELLPDDKVRLKKENGAILDLPLSKLSQIDQDYIKQLGE